MRRDDLPDDEPDNPQAPEDKQLGVWVREGDDERRVQVCWAANESRRDGMTDEWIMEQLEHWSSDNWDDRSRSHLQQLIDAAPIRLHPLD